MSESFVFTNNFNTTLSAAATASATTFSVSSTSGLPTQIPGGFALPITLNDAATGAIFEVVYCVAISGSNLAVIRAQEGTGAQAWAAGDHIWSGNTAGVMRSFAFLNGSASEAFAVLGPSNPSTEPAAVNSSNFPSSLSEPGWKKYPDPNSPTGYFIEQWGTHVGNATVNFPIAFPNQCLNVVISESAAASASWGNENITVHGVGGKTLTGFVHWTSTFIGGVFQSANNTADWTAKGY